MAKSFTILHHNLLKTDYIAMNDKKTNRKINIGKKTTRTNIHNVRLTNSKSDGKTRTRICSIYVRVQLSKYLVFH